MPSIVAISDAGIAVGREGIADTLSSLFEKFAHLPWSRRFAASALRGRGREHEVEREGGAGRGFANALRALESRTRSAADGVAFIVRLAVFCPLPRAWDTGNVPVQRDCSALLH